MEAGEISRKYATAIFSLALEEWLGVLNNVQSHISNDSNLVRTVKDTNLPFAEKKAALDKAIPANAIQPVRNFLYTLLKAGDVGLLDDIIGDLERLSRGGPQVQTAYVTTAIALTGEEKEKFQQTLRAKHGDNLEFLFRTDSSIIGGAIVQVGDKLIDGSVASRLEALSNTVGVKS